MRCDPCPASQPPPSARSHNHVYGRPGVAYVYLNYGVHYLLNAVTEGEGQPAAVLIRALVPEAGQATMRRRRGLAGADTLAAEAALCRGPGNLGRAMAITLRQNGADLCGGSRLTLEEGPGPPGPIAWGPRIGLRVGRQYRLAIVDDLVDD